MRGVASYHKMKQELSEVGSEIRNVGGKLIRAGRQKQREIFNKISRELEWWWVEVCVCVCGGGGLRARLIIDQLAVYLLNLKDIWPVKFSNEFQSRLISDKSYIFILSSVVNKACLFSLLISGLRSLLSHFKNINRILASWVYLVAEKSFFKEHLTSQLLYLLYGPSVGKESQRHSIPTSSRGQSHFPKSWEPWMAGLCLI